MENGETLSSSEPGTNAHDPSCPSSRGPPRGLTDSTDGSQSLQTRSDAATRSVHALLGPGDCTMEVVGRQPELVGDPYNIRRFAERQIADHPRAMKELRAGHKASCWSWWIMPTPPFIRDGREVGSGMNAQYAIRSDEEATSFLNYGSLRQNYMDIMSIVAEQLESGITPRQLLGIDVPRCKASATYFRDVAARLEHDDELYVACSRVLKALAIVLPRDARRPGLFAGIPKRL